jgi:hypothetical protein
MLRTVKLIVKDVARKNLDRDSVAYMHFAFAKLFWKSKKQQKRGVRGGDVSTAYGKIPIC